MFEDTAGRSIYVGRLEVLVSDPRLTNQERYLKGVVLGKCRYEKPSDRWDHDHCAFCGTKFSERNGDLHEGYSTKDNYYWVCPKCYEDFKDMFKWRLEG